MHTKASAPAGSEATGISAINISVSLPQGELPLQENRLPTSQLPDSLHQNGSLPAQDDHRARRPSYAERRLSRHL